MDNKDLATKIFEGLIEIKVTLARHEALHERNTASLEHHVKRTDLAEDNIRLLQDHDAAFREELTSKISEELKPIKAHIAFVNGAIWALGIAGAIIIALHQLGIIQKLLA